MKGFIDGYENLPKPRRQHTIFFQTIMVYRANFSPGIAVLSAAIPARV
jgi:hypothetical protein